MVQIPARTHRRPLIHRVFRAQVLAATGAGLVGLGFGPLAGWSALLGAVVGLTANAYFAVRVLGSTREEPATVRPELAFGSLMRAEIAKLAMTIALVALVFAWVKELNVVAFVVALVTVHLSGAFASLDADDGSRDAGKSETTRTRQSGEC